MEGVDVHPEPTVATVKQLYARAFRCAHPECAKPLYRQDDETGEHTLNSHVAHIHARRRGGPRWIEMTSQDNRAAANLVLLCIEHSYEVDERPDRFPADLLRSWKAAQLAEHHEVLMGWPLTDEKAETVRRASFASFREQAQAQVDATTLAELARQVEAARTIARRGREGPRAQARHAQHTWAQARDGLVAWDAVTGERLYAEPPMMDQAAHRRALLEALEQAGRDVAVVADRVRGEVAALRAARPEGGSWADWVLRALDGLESACVSWPDELPAEDDDRVEHAGNELARAAGGLDRRIRGLEAATPPAPPQEPEPATPDRTQEAHEELLETARPFARVDTRPYDPELQRRLVEATAYAATVAPTWTNIAVGLEATAMLAARVAGNATPEELLGLVARDRRRRPVCAATMLVRELAVLATERGHDSIAEQAKATLVALFDETDWADEHTWSGCEVNGAGMFGWFAAASSPQRVRDTLADAVRATPALAPTILRSCASWVERRDSRRMDQPGVAVRTYNDVPPWLPATELLEALPQLPRDPAGPRAPTDELDRLAAELAAGVN